MTQIQVKRVYSDPDGSPSDDGMRIYVDRLWPRGESKDKFHYDMWAKDIAPSTALREWYHQSPVERWEEFGKRYVLELRSNPAVDALIAKLRCESLVTLLYSSKDEEHNNAVVLAGYLRTCLA